VYRCEPDWAPMPHGTDLWQGQPGTGMCKPCNMYPTYEFFRHDSSFDGTGMMLALRHETGLPPGVQGVPASSAYV